MLHRPFFFARETAHGQKSQHPSRSRRMKLFAHAFSSYCQKAIAAFYENDIAFDYRVLEDEAAFAELGEVWSLKRFPVLIDGDRTIFEATSIIEHLALHHPGPVALIPDDPAVAAEVRMLDRFFDNYVMTPMQKHVADAMMPPEQKDPTGVARGHATLDLAYRWLDARMAERTWAVGNGFTMADLAAAPALFYADWVRPIGEDLPHARAYRARLLARPSIARCVDEARPYRPFFPPGAPDRD
jgi:glutathione S-transferase